MTAPTISAAKASESTTVASHSTRDSVSNMMAAIAKIAATTTMARPMNIIRTFCDISVRKRANSF
jgi:hypothetical protein